MLNKTSQNVLHIACYNGSVKCLRVLLTFFVGQSIHECIDKSGHTPLDLACCRGFNSEEKQVYFDREVGVNISLRSKCAELLLNAHTSNLMSPDRYVIKARRYRKKGMNTPLHWAVYWGDGYLAYLAFKASPDLVFCLNRDSCTPFDVRWTLRSKECEAYAENVSKESNFEKSHNLLFPLKSALFS